MLLSSLWIVLVATAVAQEERVGKHDWELMSIDSETGQDELCKMDPTLPCRTLEFALNGSGFHKRAVSVGAGTHIVRSKLKLAHSQHVIIRGNGAVVDCQKVGSLRIENCSDVTLTGIQFKNCGSGFIHNLDPMEKNESGCFQAAIVIRNTVNVTMEDISIHQHVGVGIALLNTTGVVKVSRFDFQGIALTSDECKDLLTAQNCIFACKPSGFLMDTYGTPSRQTTLQLSDSSFKGIAQDQSAWIATSSIPTSDYTELAGGLTLLFNSKASKTNTFINNCTFSKNTARNGGAILVKFKGDSHDNLVLINGSVFTDNVATLQGGALMVSFCSNKTSRRTNNVTINYGQFIHNEAAFGGAISHRTEGNDLVLGDEFAALLQLSHCVLSSNIALVGSAINLRYGDAKIADSTIEYGGCKRLNGVNGGSGHGAIRCMSSNLHLRGVKLWFNKYTAVVIESCRLQLAEKVNFLHNSGFNGGALAVYSGSVVKVLPNAAVSFMYNSVKDNGGKGGAIFVKNDRFALALQEKASSCFLSIPTTDDATTKSDTPQMLFYRNKAGVAMGTAIFISTAQQCIFPRESLPLHSNGSIVYKDNMAPYIVTNPVDFNIRVAEWKNVLPGSTISPTITVLDELQQSVYGTVKVEMLPLRDGEMKYVTVAGSNVFYVKDRINITVIGRESSPFKLAIELTNDFILTRRNVFKDFFMGACKPGFYQRKGEGTCRCLSEQGDRYGVMLCNGETAHILKGLWADTTGKGPLETRPCPDGYCNPSCTKRTPLGCDFNAQLQCNKGRKWDSTLCGSCKNGSSVRFGDESCIDDCEATIVEVLKLMGIFVLIAMFILVIMYVNVNAYSGYMNSVLHSYQVIGTFLVGNAKVDKVIGTVIGVGNLQGTGGLFTICIWKGMDDLDKMTLNYVIPIFVIGFVGFVCFIASRRKGCYFTRNSCTASFAILSVFAYSDFTRISFKLLNYSTVKGKRVLYYAGDVPYFSDRHLYPGGIIAILVMVFIVILFPLVILLSSSIVTVFPSFVRFDPIFEAFKSCYKPNMRCFSVFYFVARLMMLAAGTFIPHSTLQSVVLTCMAMVIAEVFIVFQPYDSPNKYKNYFDALLLCNILLIGILTTGFGCIFLDDHRISMEKAVNILLYVPLAALLLRIIVVKIVPKGFFSGQEHVDGLTARAPFPKRAAGMESSDQKFDNIPYHEVPS